MKKENILVLVLVCMAAAGIYFYTGTGDGKAVESQPETESSGADTVAAIDFMEYAPGLEKAKESGKPVFLYFHADWCTYCRKFKQETFKDERVIRSLSQNFVSISVDTEVHKQIAAKWRVQGLPTLWFLTASGDRIGSLPGFVDADQFVDVLKQVLDHVDG